MTGADGTLVRQVLSGDEDAFEALVERHKGAVYALVVGKTGNFASAEDLVQETFVEAYLHLKSLKDPGKFPAWVRGIAVNLSNKWIQKRKPDVPIDNLDRSEEAALQSEILPETFVRLPQAPDSLYEVEEMRNRVLGAVEALSEKHREAVLLHYMEGMTYREIAGLLEVPETTVLGRLQVARDQLREELRPVVEETLKAQRPTSELTRKVMAALPGPFFLPSVPQGAGLSGFLKAGALWKALGLLGAATLGTALYFTGISAVIQYGRTTIFRVAEGLPTVMLELEGDERRRAGDKAQVSGQDAALQVSAQQARKPRKAGSETPRPKLGISGAPTDSVVMITYTVPESAHVELEVYDRPGMAVAMPVYRPQPAGEYTVTLNKGKFPRGRYFTVLTLDHDPRRQARRRFNHHPPGVKITQSREEEKLLAMAATGAQHDPQRSVELLEKLLNEYPTYIDRGTAFLHSLHAYCIVSDSATVHAMVDSAVIWNPHAHAYWQVAQSLGGMMIPPGQETKRYLSTAVHFARKALESIESEPNIPPPRIEERRFQYLQTLGQLYLLTGADNQAERALERALYTFKSLPSQSNLVKSKWWSLEMLKDLGQLKERKGDFDTAIDYYTQGLHREPLHSEIWLGMRRTYERKYGSGEGYDRFREALEKKLPEPQIDNKPIPKFPFPDFTLHTLEGRAISLSDLKGKVAVVNFWAFWCGACFMEMPILDRLYKGYKDQSVEVIGIHTRLGRMGSVENDREVVKVAMDRHLTSFPQVFDTAEANLHSKLRIQMIPTTFVLDKKGGVRYRQAGHDQYRSYENFKREIERLVAEE